MIKEEARSVAVTVDRLILESRLKDIFLLAQTDRSDRVGTMAMVITKLRPGAYLLGCGPYCCGILPLTVDVVVLGRPSSPLETIPDTVVDYAMNDAVWMVPREASRVHASIFRKIGVDGADYSIRDNYSKTGTFVNGIRLTELDGEDDTMPPKPLTNGDIISLGPSGVNCYVFVKIT